MLVWLCWEDGSLHEQKKSYLVEVGKTLQLEKEGILHLLEEPQYEIEATLDLIETDWVKEQLAVAMVSLALRDGDYSAFERTLIDMVAYGLNISIEYIEELEEELASAIVKLGEELSTRNQKKKKEEEWDWGKMLQVGAFGAAGAAALVATGGIAAPIVGGIIGSTFMGLSGAAATSAGLAFLGGGSLAAGGFGMAGGTAVVTSIMGITGAAVGASKGVNLHKDVKEFELVHVKKRISSHCIVGISGFLSQKSFLQQTWRPLCDAYPHADVFTLRWESKTIQDLSDMLHPALSKVASAHGLGTLGSMASKAAPGKILWPLGVLQILDLIDNPWMMASRLAEKTGKILGEAIEAGCLGNRPLTLVGHSLGSRVIVHALDYLAQNKVEDRVYDAYLLSGAVSENSAVLDRASQAVSRTLANVYSREDWVLSYLYRTASLLETAIGLTPLEREDVVDIDMTHIIGAEHRFLDKDLGEVMQFIRSSLGDR